MTNEEMRIEVAEELGWKWYRRPATSWPAKPHRALYHPDISTEYVKELQLADMTERQCNEVFLWREGMIPNWPEDLNACREMWNAPFAPPFEDDFNYRCEMAFQLHLIVKRDYEAHQDLVFFRCDIHGDFDNLIRSAQEWIKLNASGRQLCESFLRVRNRWKE